MGLLSAHETSGSSFILQVWAMCQSEWQGDGSLISWKLGLFWADEFSRAALSNQVIARKQKRCPKPVKSDHFKRKIVFQPSFVRDYVSYGVSNLFFCWGVIRCRCFSPTDVRRTCMVAKWMFFFSGFRWTYWINVLRHSLMEDSWYASWGTGINNEFYASIGHFAGFLNHQQDSFWVYTLKTKR